MHENLEICEYLTFKVNHRMSYVHLPGKNLDKKRSAKDEIPIKCCMRGNLFVYSPNKYFIMWEYLCDYDECLCLNFLPYVKNTSKFIENKNSDTDNSEDCLLDEENDPTKIFEFVTIPSFVAVIPCIYIIKIVEKNMTKDNLRDRFGHEIFSGEYFKGILFAEE